MSQGLVQVIEKWERTPRGHPILVWTRRFEINVEISRCEKIRRFPRERGQEFVRQRHRDTSVNRDHSFVYQQDFELRLKNGKKVCVDTSEYSLIDKWWCPICHQPVRYGVTALKRHLLQNADIRRVSVKGRVAFYSDTDEHPLIRIFEIP